MAIRNPKLFGLNVLSFLIDVENKNLALRALNLPPLDLDVIRGSANAGATRRDWISYARLKQPIHKALIRYNQDSLQYSDILDDRAGTNAILFGNLEINGALSGNAIRYRYIKGLGTNTRSIGIADISTSRVSAWSSSANPVIASSPISYGARVGVRAGAALQFGTPTNASQIRLRTTLQPQSKEFDAEFPTSEIEATIGGQTVRLYAMKGIPIIFRGFFRNVNATIKLNAPLTNGVSPSWRIVETNNSNAKTDYTNWQGLSSSISYRSSVSRERNIQYYYNPDRINYIVINSANLEELPTVKLLNVKVFHVAYNNLKNFPDLNSITPIVENLNLSHNKFYLGENSSERTLNSAIIAKLPSSITELYLGSTFYGSIDADILSKFTSLQILNLSRSWGPYFHPDGVNANTPIPNVPNTCTSYNINSNDFRSIDASPAAGLKNVNQLTGLTNLVLNSNYYLGGTLSVHADNDVINYISISATNLNYPNVRNKQSLVTFYGTYCRSAGGLFDGDLYKFDNCNSLQTLHCYASGLSGNRFPRFTNAALTYLDLRWTGFSGGYKDGANTNDDFFIHDETFRDCVSLRDFYIANGGMLAKPIATTAFTYCPNLQNIIINSYGRVDGEIPNFNQCSNLRSLNLYYNAFTTGTPNFQATPNIHYVYLAYNRLQGTIPGYKNLSNLYYLYMHNNKFTGLSEFENLPNLRYFYCHNQLVDGNTGISGQIPDFSSCPRMYYLVMYNNNFSSYKTGSLAALYNLRYFDISNNSLSSQAIDQIVDDLYTNYESVPRGGVSINIRGNQLPGPDALDQIIILRSKGWSITYQ